MKWKKFTPLRWFCLVLFILYAGGMSLFTHSHIINKTTYIHSHPYKSGDQPSHNHTGKELQLLDQIFNTSITADIIPMMDVGITPSIAFYYPDCYQTDHLLPSDAPKQLRAPPVIS